MCEKGDPLENTVAERVNGIMRTEYFAYIIIADRSQAESILAKAVLNYNTVRLHISCGMLTPEKVHKNNVTIKRAWKNYYLRKTVQLSQTRSE